MSRCCYPFGYFTFPVPHTGPAAADRLAVPPEVAMRWYWRVRTWVATFTVQATYGFDLPGGHATVAMAASIADSVGRPAFYIAPGYIPTIDSESNLIVPLMLDY